MIKFFRRIRLDLMEKNKTGKYLKYAMGEIILVVIGILLALQINNWNEQRKEANIELELLQSLKSGLEKDLDDLDGNVKSHKRGIAASDSIFYALENKKPIEIPRISRNFSDFMTTTYFLYSTSAFETLKSKGITIISNAKLRDEIIGVYDSQYNFFLKFQGYFIEEVERGYTEIFPSRFKDSYSYDLTKSDFPGHLEPLDFEALKSDQEFLYYIKSLRNRMIIFVEWQYGNLRRKIVDLINDTEKEIKKLNN